MSRKSLATGLAAAALVGLAGCEHKTTRKVTVETPEKKYEVKVEKTEKGEKKKDRPDPRASREARERPTPMATLSQTRFQSGAVCTQSGRFAFDGYVAGGWLPAPDYDELIVDVVEGERFPRIRPDRSCWWTPADGGRVEADEAIARMVAEGGHDSH